MATFTPRPQSHRKPNLLRFRAFLVLAMLASGLALVPAVAPPASAAPAFADVPAGQFYTDAVAWLADSAITTGTSPTTFSPDEIVTRGQMAAFLERYAQSTGVPGEHGFADVPSGAFYDGPVSFLRERDITTGTSPTTYSPNDFVNRAQMATFIFRFSNEPTPTQPMPFTDVAPGTYYYEPVQWLSEKGITTGTTPTTYSPFDFVTRGQMATFLWRLAGEPLVGELGANRIDTDNTVIAEEEEVAFTTVDLDGPSTLEWTGAEADKPATGDALVVGVTEDTPEGFIGVVTNVSGDVVTTAPATITDVVDEADFASSIDMDGQGFDAFGIGDVFDTRAASCTGNTGSLSADIQMDVEGSLDVSASWSLTEGVEAYTGFSNDIQATVTLRADAGVECVGIVGIDGPVLGAFTIFVGPLPLVITPQLRFAAEVSGGFAVAVETTWTYEVGVSAGMRYSDGDWSTEYGTSSDSSWTQPTFSGEVSVGLQLSAVLTFKVNGVGGPYIALSPFFEFNVQNDIPWWNLDAGVRLQLGVEFDVGFFEADIEFAEFELYRETMFDSGNTPFPGGFQYLNPLALKSVDAGARHACGVDGAGNVWCWGTNSRGELGRGFTSVGGQHTAARVENIDDAIEVSTNWNYSCAVLSDGTVWCWGNNEYGQLGDGTETTRDTPVQVVGITNAIEVDAGHSGACAVLEDRTVRCWGMGYTLGDGSFDPNMGGTQHSTVPVTVSGLNNVNHVSVGWGVACAATVYGELWCWGQKFFSGPSLLGVGVTFAGTPVNFPATNVRDVAVSSGGHACLQNRDLRVFCWGEGASGQLGNNNTFDREVAFEIDFISGDVVDIDVGTSHTCATVVSGAAYCWGYGAQGQLGNGLSGQANQVDQPTLVNNSNDFVTVTTGDDFSCALYISDAVLCWGRNTTGQLGDKTNTTRLAPSNPVRNPAS